MSCGKNGEPEYVRQDQLEIKTFPITPLIVPCLLPDGSIVTLVEDNAGKQRPMTDDFLYEPSYHLVKLAKDGTMSQSPKLSFYFGYTNARQLRGTDTDDEGYGIKYSLDITAQGEVIFQYRNNKLFGVSKMESGVYIDHYAEYLGGAPLSDGNYAIISPSDKSLTMSIIDSDGNQTQTYTLPYFTYDKKGYYEVYGICGNVMIVAHVADAADDYYIYSPNGQLLNYGTSEYTFDLIVNIIDPSTNTPTHCYAITSDMVMPKEDNASGEEDSEEDNASSEEDSETQAACIIRKLDTQGHVIYQKYVPDVLEIDNIIEQDGQLICAGYYSDLWDQMSDENNFNQTTRLLTSVVGKIITLNAVDGNVLSSNTISLEGGVRPYAAVPDGKGGMHIYMSRYFSSDVGQMTSSSLYGSSIYIYHIDDLNKLNIE